MKHFLKIFAVVFVLAITSSCIKEQYDNPPSGGVDPNITVNFSIDSVKARWSGTNYQFTDDRVISAVIVADDKSGNLYKQLAIVDSTGGITLLIDGSSLYTDMPIGRRLFIKLKGMWVVQYNGLFQLCAYINADGSFGGVPTVNLDKYVLKGKWGIEVKPDTVSSLALLGDKYQSKLIYLEGVEFATADAGKPFADGYNKKSLGRMLKNCTGSTAEVYTSGYSSFANNLTPTGNGNFVCLYSVYSGDAQLIIRDLTDLHLDSPRCGGGVPNSGIGAVRNMYGGSDLILPSGTSINGVVISDYLNGNTNSQNVIVQDANAGILVRFTTTHTLALNDSVHIDLSGGTLEVYNGLLEVTGLLSSAVTSFGPVTVTPRTATISQVLANGTAWESTLVKITGATITGGTTYSGNKTITDASGNMIMYTAGGASFATTTYPTGTVSLTGYINNFNGTIELMLRNLTDVQ